MARASGSPTAHLGVVVPDDVDQVLHQRTSALQFCHLLRGSKGHLTAPGTLGTLRQRVPGGRFTHPSQYQTQQCSPPPVPPTAST